MAGEKKGTGEPELDGPPGRAPRGAVVRGSALRFWYLVSGILHKPNRLSDCQWVLPKTYMVVVAEAVKRGSGPFRGLRCGVSSFPFWSLVPVLVPCPPSLAVWVQLYFLPYVWDETIYRCGSGFQLKFRKPFGKTKNVTTRGNLFKLCDVFLFASSVEAFSALPLPQFNANGRPHLLIHPPSFLPFVDPVNFPTRE